MKKQSCHTALWVILTVIALTIAGCFITALQFAGAKYSGDDRMLYIPRHATRQSIQDSLTTSAGRAGANASRMLQWRGINPSRLYGAYMLRRDMSATDIYMMLSRRRQTPVRLTFNNIRTIDQLAARIAATIDISPHEFLSAVDSILSDIPAAERIGRFMPDTYEIFWTSSASKAVNTLTRQYDRFWNDTRREKAAKLGLTPQQIVVVASIAEEETNDPAERGTVGRLYINRLRRGMPLQADPTVKYAVGDFSLRRITGTHLAINSPYNTYLHAGLPPGPIRMPAATTIDAILNAPSNNYLYMCAKEDFSGKHNFTADYSTHLANARRYHQALNARNIR